MNQPPTTSFPRTIGMDLGSRTTSSCVVATDSKRIDEGVLKTVKTEMKEFLEDQPPRA